MVAVFFFFFSSRRRHTRFDCDWSSDVCSSDLSLQEMFHKYNLQAKTWADLTLDKSGPRAGAAAPTGSRAERYQELVPSAVVMFAFFLVLNVGWLFVGERRQGTLLRLRAAPLARSEILFGKLLPCY